MCNKVEKVGVWELHAQTVMERLPDDVQEHIYGACDVEDVTTLALVSKRVNSVVSERRAKILNVTQFPFSIRSVWSCRVFSMIPIMSERARVFFDALSVGCLSQLQCLDLHGASMGDAGVRALASVCAQGALKRLEVRACVV